MKMDFQRLLSLIQESDDIQIRTHENADADAVGASLALKLAIKALGKAPVVLTPRPPSKIGRLLAQIAGEAVETREPAKTPDLTIFVDARPPSDYKAQGRLAVIDHHEAQGEIQADFLFVDSHFSSASEMVFEFLEYLVDVGSLDGISKPIAVQLLSGIIADTGDLKLAVGETLQRIVRITAASGVELKSVFPLLRTPLDPSLRMACLKGASRLSVKSAGGRLIATTRVSSFQGDVASCLIHLGADVAFAAGKRKGIVSVSGRARGDLVDAGLSLAQVMEAVASRLKGEGGGHGGAAALKCGGEVDEVLKMCVAETMKAMGTSRDTGQSADQRRH